MQPRRQFNTSVDAGRSAAPGRTGRLRVRSLAARSLMVVLLAALGMLLGMPQQAEAQTATALWSGTLTVKAMSGDFGCSNSITNNHCSDHLTDDDFRYDSTDYAITGIVVRSSGELEIEFDTTLTNATKALTLNVGSTAFNFVDADTMGTESLIWNNSGLSWSAGDTVTLTLMTPPIEVDIKTFAVFIEDNQGGLDIRLKSEPGADVTVNLESSDTGIFTVSRASFTFTPMNWDVEQGPDIIPVQDADALDEMGTLTVSGADFDDILVEVVIVDDDLLLTLPQSPVALNEEETTTFEVALASAPVRDREVYMKSDDTGAVTVDPLSLEFTSENWNTSQTVTVTGVADDDPKDEQVTITVEVTGVTAGTVTVDVTDDDEPGVTIVPTTLDVVEGGTATYTVKLDTIPTADVAVAITSSDTGKATVLPETPTFTTVNWQTAQTVTVTGVEDADTTNDAVTLTHSATSTDTDYQGIMIAGVTVTVEDNDTAQVTGVMVEPGNGQLGVEWTAVANATGYEVQWKSSGQSYNNSGRQATVGSGSTTSHTISSLSNGTAYTVRVTATRTGANDGLPSEEVTKTPVMPTTEGVTVSESALTVTEEDTTGESYTVVLDSQPTESVTVMVAGHAGTDVTANPASLTFTTTDWETAQTVTVTAGNDADTTDDTVTLTHNATSLDADYDSIAVASVRVTVSDNDSSPPPIIGGGGGGGGFGPALIAPKFVDGFRTSRPLYVTAQVGDAVGDPVTATHPNDFEVTYHLSGTDAALFTVDEETGQIRLGQAITPALGQTYTVNLTGTDSGGTGAIIIVDIAVEEAPYHRYDLNRNGIIEKNEVLEAVGDYFSDVIEKPMVLEVISLYFAS